MVYGRGAVGRRMIRTATSLPERFVVYGCEGPPAANIEYKPPSAEQFADDLASCRAVFCMAGQQLIGEARYFGKPLLVVPFPNQHEQEINARYVRKEGIGDFCPVESLTRQRLRTFLRQPLNGRQPINGVDQVLELTGIGHG